MSTVASQITNLSIVYSTVYSAADQRKYQSSASLAFVRGFHRWPVNSPHKGPVTRKMFPFDDVIMIWWRHHVKFENHRIIFIIIATHPVIYCKLRFMNKTIYIPKYISYSHYSVSSCDSEHVWYWCDWTWDEKSWNIHILYEHIWQHEREL